MKKQRWIAALLAAALLTGCFPAKTYLDGQFSFPASSQSETGTEEETEEETEGETETDEGVTPLVGFQADVFDIYLDTEKLVTFTVNVLEGLNVLKNSLSVYDEDEQFIAYMNDEGQDGDEIAGDGIYTCQKSLSSSEVKLVNYHAGMDGKISNSWEISFYRDITQDEFTSASQLCESVSEMTFEDACTYASGHSDEIQSYEVDNINRTITYRTAYGITGLWMEEPDPDLKGNGELAVPSSAGADYDAVRTQMASAEFRSLLSDNDVMVMRPFRGSEFTYDDFQIAGDILASGLGGNLTVRDDGDVTLDIMKSLGDYGVVLMDSHGTLKSGKTPYMLIGEELNESKFLWDPVYYVMHAGYSADYLSGRILCTGHNNRLAVGGKFFDKYYSSGSLDGSFWFLGTCYSMYDSSISGVLTAKGAEAVAGFTNVVSVPYCNNTLFEMVLNSMLLSADTAGNGMRCAKDIYGNVDPRAGNGATELVLRGDSGFRMDEITLPEGTLTGKVCMASDRSTPVPGAAITVYRNGEEYLSSSADASGGYTLMLPAGNYNIVISAEGYIDFASYADVVRDENTYMETFLMVEGSEEQQGTAEGTIFNALTGTGVEGVSLTVRKGWNNTNRGDVVTASSTDGNGNYSLTLPCGNYTVFAEKSGFIPGTVSIVVQEGTTSSQNGTISPEISGSSFRVVLTWGENPSDLDSHVEGLMASGRTFHTYYWNKSARNGDTEVCNLDVDDTTSYGPETITLNTETSSPYYYYVHRYAGRGSVADSGAQVKLYQGADLIASFNAPSDQGNADYWNVFALVDGDLQVRNTITSAPEREYAGAIH